MKKRKLFVLLLVLTVLGTLPLFQRCGVGVGTPEAGDAAGTKI